MLFVILLEILGKTNLNGNRFWRCTLNSRATQTIPFHYFYYICSVRMESSQTITSRWISHCFLIVAFWLRPGFNWNTFFWLARQQSDHPCSTVERLNCLSILQKSHVYWNENANYKMEQKAILWRHNLSYILDHACLLGVAIRVHVSGHVESWV